METQKYEASGSVRGSCGHEHETILDAWQCAKRDDHACWRVGGYSDRRPCRVGGEHLGPEEWARLQVDLEAL